MLWIYSFPTTGEQANEGAVDLKRERDVRMLCKMCRPLGRQQAQEIIVDVGLANKSCEDDSGALWHQNTDSERVAD